MKKRIDENSFYETLGLVPTVPFKSSGTICKINKISLSPKLTLWLAIQPVFFL